MTSDPAKDIHEESLTMDEIEYQEQKADDRRENIQIILILLGLFAACAAFSFLFM